MNDNQLPLYLYKYIIKYVLETNIWAIKDMIFVCKLFQQYTNEFYPNIVRRYLEHKWPYNMIRLLYIIKYSRDIKDDILNPHMMHKGMSLIIAAAFTIHISVPNKSILCAQYGIPICLTIKLRDIEVSISRAGIDSMFEVSCIRDKNLNLWRKPYGHYVAISQLSSPTALRASFVLTLMQRIFSELVGRIAM